MWIIASLMKLTIEEFLLGSPMNKGLGLLNRESYDRKLNFVLISKWYLVMNKHLLTPWFDPQEIFLTRIITAHVYSFTYFRLRGIIPRRHLVLVWWNNNKADVTQPYRRTVTYLWLAHRKDYLNYVLVDLSHNVIGSLFA